MPAIVKELSLSPLPEDVHSFVQKTMVLPVLEESTGIRVDFIFSSTPYEAQAIGRARRIVLAGLEQLSRYFFPFIERKTFIMT